MFGYIITAYGHEALEMYEECDRIRYAARLDNMYGIVAFDGEVAGMHLRAGSVIHIIHDAQEPIPESPDTWPDWHRILAPKRRISNGREHFAFVSTDFRKAIMETESVTGAVDVGNGQILVESDGPIAAGFVWSGGVVEFRDRRIDATKESVTA